MNTLRQALYEKDSSKGSKELKEIAKAYDQMTLGYDFYPGECLDLIFEILTRRAFHEARNGLIPTSLLDRH